MANNSKAFFKGSAGCLVLFVVAAIFAVIFGGTAHIDLGGFVILAVIGGVIGIGINLIYQKGKRDSDDSE